MGSALLRAIGEGCFTSSIKVFNVYLLKSKMLDGVMLSQIPSMYKMESNKKQFLPLCYSVYTLTKLSSYYAVQRLDAKSRVSMQGANGRKVNYGQGCNVRKVNCSFVYSAYTLKPVLSGRNL